MEENNKKKQIECKSKCFENNKLLMITSIINFITLVIVLIKLLLK